MNPDQTPGLLALPALDWMAIGMLLVFSLLGAFRGGAWQFRRFLGVLLAMLVARLLAPLASPTVTALIDPTQPRLGLGISYLLLFLFTLCMLALLFKFLKPKRKGSKRKDRGEDEEEAPKPSKHRLLGLSFGVLTACALYSTLITCVLLLDPQGSTRPSFSSSRGARWTSQAITSLGEAFPLQARQSTQSTAKPR